MLEITDTFFNIVFDEGYQLDANNLLEYAQFARNLVSDFFVYYYDKKVRIRNFKNPARAREYRISLDWEFMRSNWVTNEIYCLTESESDYDHIWYRANIVHEYVHCYLGNYLYDTSSKRMKVFFPLWFQEGIAGYIPYYHGNDEIQRRYQQKVEDHRDKAKRDNWNFDEIASDEYFGGALIVKTMYEIYNKEDIESIFICAESSWCKAVETELQINYSDFLNEIVQEIAK